ncbi:MAG: phosphatase PAP2 family protein [Myxococcales bacterium]|nr:phosphatase PAP2 family protein [Myxococcales bacterium]
MRPSRPWVTVGRVSWLIFLRWLVLVSAAIVFASLAGAVLADSTAWLDLPLIRFAEGGRGGGLTQVMRAFTWLGNGPTLAGVAVVAAVGLVARGQRVPALFVAVVAVGAGGLNALLKLAFSRPRPLLMAQLAHAGGYSFPSGHAMAGAAIYGALAVVAVRRFPRQRWWVVGASVVTVFAIGASRVYLGVHYPSDVVAGWALGVSWPLWLGPLLLARSSVGPAPAS